MKDEYFEQLKYGPWNTFPNKYRMDSLNMGTGIFQTNEDSLNMNPGIDFKMKNGQLKYGPWKTLKKSKDAYSLNMVSGKHFLTIEG